MNVETPAIEVSQHSGVDGKASLLNMDSPHPWLLDHSPLLFPDHQTTNQRAFRLIPRIQAGIALKLLLKARKANLLSQHLGSRPTEGKW